MLIRTETLTTPALARGAVYNFPAEDTVQHGRENPAEARALHARVVEVAVTADKPLTVLAQGGQEYDPNGPWWEVGRLELEAGEEARNRFVVEPARWARLRVEAGANTGPVTLTVTWHEG